MQYSLIRLKGKSPKRGESGERSPWSASPFWGRKGGHTHFQNQVTKIGFSRAVFLKFPKKDQLYYLHSVLILHHSVYSGKYLIAITIYAAAAAADQLPQYLTVKPLYPAVPRRNLCLGTSKIIIKGCGYQYSNSTGSLLFFKKWIRAFTSRPLSGTATRQR